MQLSAEILLEKTKNKKQTNKKPTGRIGPESQPLFLKYNKRFFVWRVIHRDALWVITPKWSMKVCFWNRDPSSTGMSVIVLFWGFCSSVWCVSGTFRAKWQLKKVRCRFSLLFRLCVVKNIRRCLHSKRRWYSEWVPSLHKTRLSFGKKRGCCRGKKGMKAGRGEGSVIIAVSITLELTPNSHPHSLTLLSPTVRKKKNVCSRGDEVQYILATPHSFSAVAVCPVGAFRERAQEPWDKGRVEGKVRGGRGVLSDHLRGDPQAKRG